MYILYAVIALIVIYWFTKKTSIIVPAHHSVVVNSTWIRSATPIALGAGIHPFWIGYQLLPIRWTRTVGNGHNTLIMETCRIPTQQEFDHVLVDSAAVSEDDQLVYIHLTYFSKIIDALKATTTSMDAWVDLECAVHARVLVVIRDTPLIILRAPEGRRRIEESVIGFEHNGFIISRCMVRRLVTLKPPAS